MNKYLLSICVIISAALISFGFMGTSDNNPPFIPNSGNSTDDKNDSYFTMLHQPYNQLTPDMINATWQQVQRTPSEKDFSPLAVNSWVVWGAYGQRIWGAPGTSYYSGRMLDIEVDNGVSTRIGAATRGLWGFFLIFPIPYSDDINTLRVGSFDTKPGSDATILLGTGELHWARTGTGLWRTTNTGTSWTNITMTPTPPCFYKMRFDHTNTNVVHAATGSGYYKSTDSGLNWSRIQLTGAVTDITINPANTNILYCGQWTDGVYKSTNAGANWTKMTTGGIPSTNVGRVGISVSASSPSTVYCIVTCNDNDQNMGVYKTTDAGTSWTTVTPPSNFQSGQGWSNCVIGVCPTSANIVIVGGVDSWRTTNRGTSWTQLNVTPDVHADQHGIAWANDGSAVWLAGDGGMQYSGDQGATWSTAANLLPITQYVNFDVNPTGSAVYGGSQDNGISGSSNHGTNWWHFLGGDGGSTAIDPVTPSKMVAINKAYGGSWAWQRMISTNSGQSFTSINTGVDPSGQSYHKIRNDKVSPVVLYNNSGQFVYRSTNYGTNWTKLNASAFPCTDILNLNVSRFTTGGAVVYASLNNNPVTANKLRVYDNGTWYERSTGFPAGNLVRGVSPHQTDANIAYAVINGFSAGNKIFKTTNRGQNWTNISGNLPDVACTDVVPHPTDNNKLYLSSEMGCYKTTNGGTNWVRWNNGMPEATIVSELVYLDSIAANGKYYIVAATYGRSILYREISGDDPIGISGNNMQVPDKFELKQNYPNPFNPATKIEFSMPVEGNAALYVYDVTGRMVSKLVDGNLKAGIHKFSFDGKNISSGIYFYKLVTEKLIETKKMILVK